MDLNDPTTVALLAVEAFRAAGYEHALYGGLLTAAYGEPRETRDADVAVVNLQAGDAVRALAVNRVRTVIAFEDIRFGGLFISRLTVIEARSSAGLNTIDLVCPRSARYASAAMKRAATSTLRGTPVRLLTPEDFIVFKLLSTRDLDLEDARGVLRRSGAVLDIDVINAEIGALGTELTDVDVSGRWGAVRG